MITEAFRNVCLKVAQAEAQLEPVEQRLARKVIRHLATLTTLPLTNPAAKVTRKTLTQGKKHLSPLRVTWDQYYKYLAREKTFKLTQETTWCKPTWTSFTRVKVDYSVEEAIRFHSTTGGHHNLYTDASVRNGLCGAVVVRGTHPYQCIRAETIGYERYCSILTTEATALVYAIRHIVNTANKRVQQYIFTDSKAVLDLVVRGEKGGINSSTYTTLLQLLRIVSSDGLYVTIRWIPAHRGIQGNERADQITRDMTTIGRLPKEASIIEKRRLLKVLDKVAVTRTTKTYTKGKYGKFTWKLDGALPGRHTQQLYRNLSSDQARILVQARTGHNHLNVYKARLKVNDSGMCECGEGIEDIQHLLIRCRLWAEQREKLRQVAKDRLNDVSFLLGGWSARREWRTGKPVDGDRVKWKPNLAVVKATVQFLQSTGRMALKEVSGREGEKVGGRERRE